MGARVPLPKKMLLWAIDRSGVEKSVLVEKIKPLKSWLDGNGEPTLRQLEDFAKATRTPLGYLFLEEPPVEKIDIPDFRTFRGTAPRKFSPDLIDTVHEMRLRQTWMRDELESEDEPPLPFVDSHAISNPNGLATEIRNTLNLDVEWASQFSSWEEALVSFRRKIEDLGVLVFVSNVVGLNNRRKLNPSEFRGFVLCDPYAPLIFVNSSDTRSAQMFTLAHELAHIWIGEDTLFNLEKMKPFGNAIEKYCDMVAAELLVPAGTLRANWKDGQRHLSQIESMSQKFRVSPLVIARRALDLGLISSRQFSEFYREDRKKWLAMKEQKRRDPSKPPLFYTMQRLRLGTRFPLAIARATQEGRLQYTDAFALTGLKRTSFFKFADRLLNGAKSD